jgi:hypothetical protein
MEALGNLPAKSPAKSPANPSATSPAHPDPVAHDDYTNYSKWADEALVHASRDSDPQWIADTLNQWQQLSPQVQTAFALAVRNFKAAESAFDAARKALDETVEKVLASAGLRMLRKVTDQFHQELRAQLDARLVHATTAARNLEAMLQVHRDGEFEDEMPNLVNERCGIYIYERDATAHWLRRFKGLQSKCSAGKLDTNIAQGLATIIKAGYESHDVVVVEEDDQDSEDDHENEDDEGNVDDPDNGNVQGGNKGGKVTQEKKRRFNAEGDDEDSEETSSKRKKRLREKKDDAVSGASPSAQRQMPPFAPAAIAAAGESGDFPALQGPAPNEAGAIYVAWLYKNEETFQPEVKKWCQKQLVANEFATMQNLELFATAAYQHMMANGLVGYNWDDEGLLTYGALADAPPRPEPSGFPLRPENPTPCIKWLYDHEFAIIPGFRVWCKRQLDVLAQKKSLGDMEAFAESAIKLERVMKKPHDWENEEDLEGPPPFLLP